ncbi:MAG: M20 family peptidase [Acetobacteraceae bacterium]|nr:M20 family peptidase [Acetobacteraceae bacterium]MSP29601.1 M20 family peptidase [Acetobacteraceae bacterium]
MPATEVGRSEDLLDELAHWVRLETPTTNPVAVNQLMDIAAGELFSAGAILERIPGRDGFGDTLIARTPPGVGANGEKPILIAGHLDTVWAVGTLADMPYRVDGIRAHGPGIHDMKAGSFLAFHALRSILRQQIPTRRPITLMLTPDEEVGSPSSRQWIEREGAGAAFVLIPEPAGKGGACVTSRKGVGRFSMHIAGRGAHSGGGFQDGVSAVVELARQIQRIHEMVDLERGVTMNVAPIWGGSRPNVVPHEAGCEIDLRVPTGADGERMQRILLALEPFHPGCRLTITGEMNRPPFAESPDILALYEHAHAIAKEVGFKLPRQFRGGGSDGNFTAALGIPTLDGLGCPGSGAHVRHEHIFWQELAPRAAFLAGMLETLD